MWFWESQIYHINSFPLQGSMGGKPEPMALVCFSYGVSFLVVVFLNCFSQRLLEFALIEGPVFPTEKRNKFLKVKFKMTSILFPSNLLLISKSQLLRFSHPSFDTFLGTLIQTFSLFSPDSPKKWTSEKAAGAVLLSSAPTILVQCVTCPVGCMKGLKRRENLLVSCHVLFAVTCYILCGVFFCPSRL